MRFGNWKTAGSGETVTASPATQARRPVWMLVLLIPMLIILQRGVVEREEAYLLAKFGEAYRKYQARVPRWL